MTDDQTTYFDADLRRHHAVSLQQLTPRVRAQLAQRRRSALRDTPAIRGHRFGYAAAGLAALCALAIGMQLRAPPPARVAPTNVMVAATANPARTESTMLDQDPDFYAWLASTDAMQVAME